MLRKLWIRIYLLWLLRGVPQEEAQRVLNQALLEARIERYSHTLRRGH